MPTIKYALPKYRKHKVSGQAVVTINGTAKEEFGQS